VLIAAGVGVLIVALIGGFLVKRSDNNDKTAVGTATDSAAASDNTSTDNSGSTEPALPSAAGKPCVALADPLPAGAPDVPIQVGPPPTQLVTKDLKEGTGAVVQSTDQVTVNYIGVSCSTGKIFDSSYSRGQPAQFGLDQVIPGWTQGITGMKVGGQRLLGIPSDLGYGAQGNPPAIAPDEALWFVVEVTDAQPASAASSSSGG
jgi:peptidylprolyl isomerase